MGRDTDWAALYGDHPGDDSGDDSGGRSRPPIWVAVLVVAAFVTGAWILVTQVIAESDPVTSPTSLPVTPVEASVDTTTTAVVTTTTASVAVFDSVSIGDQPAVALTPESPQQLAGDVAVSAGTRIPLAASTVWVLRAGGSVVSRNDVPTFEALVGSYPLLMTGGHIAFTRLGSGYLLDADLIDGHEYFGSARYIIPGAEPGTLWFVDSPGPTTDAEAVTPVNVESRTLGEPIDAGAFSQPLFGVADGLIVVPFDKEKYGKFAYWSPTDGLMPLDQLGDLDTVVAASGNNVVVVSPGSVSVLDIVGGEYVGSFELPEARGRVTSACLSPDGQQVIVVGSNGWAVVGHVTYGEFIDLNAANDEFPIQPEHGIGWTTDGQLVFIGESEFGKRIGGFDIPTDESFDVATLDGPEEWWLTASGTTC